jgi:hypothetical protein
VKLAPFITLWTAEMVLRLAGTELAEVLCCFGDDFGEELEGYASERLSCSIYFISLIETEAV